MLYLCFHAGTSLLDKLVTAVERSLDYDRLAPLPMATHSYLLFLEEGADGQMGWGVEARPPRIRSWKASEEPRTGDRRYRVPLDAAQLRMAQMLAESHVGQGYHWSGDLLAAIYCLTKMSWPDREKRELFCSQLCVSILRLVGQDLLKDLPDWVINPAALEHWSTQHLERS